MARPARAAKPSWVGLALAGGWAFALLLSRPIGEASPLGGWDPIRRRPPSPWCARCAVGGRTRPSPECRLVSASRTRARGVLTKAWRARPLGERARTEGTLWFCSLPGRLSAPTAATPAQRLRRVGLLLGCPVGWSVDDQTVLAVMVAHHIWASAPNLTVLDHHGRWGTEWCGSGWRASAVAVIWPSTSTRGLSPEVSWLCATFGGINTDYEGHSRRKACSSRTPGGSRDRAVLWVRWGGCPRVLVPLAG
jgi:hypothetical protein